VLGYAKENRLVTYTIAGSTGATNITMTLETEEAPAEQTPAEPPAEQPAQSQ
jgi:hypothetical protein